MGLAGNVGPDGSLNVVGGGTVFVRPYQSGYITYVAHSESCTPYEGGTIYWTIWDTFVWNDAGGIAHSFPAAVSDFPGGRCGGGPAGSFTSGPDGSGYTMYITAGSPGGPPGAYVTGPGSTQYPAVQPL